MANENEILLKYQPEWENEWKQKGYVEEWRIAYPDQFENWMDSSKLGSKDLFAQYALMYLLRKQDNIKSITWYYLADTSKKSKNEDRTKKYWDIMKKWMGESNFNTLRNALIAGGFKSFTGEPDLFCWEEQTGKWFFAEAKIEGDSLNNSQIKWFAICRKGLAELGDIRVYKLISA
jgi:hypothetical protein